MGSFKGFGPNALSFLKGLAFHQNKEWFEENRALYEEELRQPFIALVDDLAEAFSKEGLAITGDGKRSVFRINRDIRFSKDKSPYKTHMGASMTRSGVRMEQGLLYMHVDPKGSFFAAGFHMPEPAQLLAIRNAIKAKPKSYEEMNKALAKNKLSLGEEGERLSRMPRGFEEFKGGPLQDAFLRKSFIVEEPIADIDLQRPTLVTRGVKFAKRSQPLLDFGWSALG